MVKVMRTLIFIGAFLGLLASGLLAAHAQGVDGMDFRLRTFDLRPMGMGIQHIVGATGVIRAGDAARLALFIESNHLPPGNATVVVLHSPGGDVEESMMLARNIRAMGFQTEVDQLQPNDAVQGPPGECYSACTLLFLGGVRRMVPKDARYGVHRWYFQNALTVDLNAAAADAQVRNGRLIAFVEEMGADPQLIAEGANSGPSEMNILTQVQLRQLNIITPLYITNWSIRPIVKTFEAMAVTSDEHGKGFLQFVCIPPSNGSKARFVMFVGIDGGNLIAAQQAVQKFQGQQIILSKGWASLTPEETVFKRPVLNPTDHRHIDTIIAITPRLQALIADSTELGFAYLQPFGLYDGFTGSLTPDGKSDIFAIRDSCH